MTADSIETMVLSNTYADLIVPVQSDTEFFLEKYRSYGAQLFGGRIGMIHVPTENSDLRYHSSYSNIPKLYTLLDYESLNASGILKVQNNPSLGYKGKNVLLGFLDTGIDYTRPIFRTPFGQSKILGIWDQTISSSKSPYDLGYGTAYSREQIQLALQSNEPLSLVPSMDQNGHGTFLAGIAAGSPDPIHQFLGVAPEADLAVVKLKEAKSYLKNYFLTDSTQPVFQETDIMMGIRYLVILSILYEKPLVICLGLGTSQGDHSGNSSLDRLLTYYVDYQNCFCTCASGNEASAGHHFFSSDTSGLPVSAELNVTADHPGFCMELWAMSPALYTLSVTSPLGETISEITPQSGARISYQFLGERTVLDIDYAIAEYNSGFQLIFLRMFTPTEGIWTFRIRNRTQLKSTFHIWLPVTHFLSKDVFFLTPDPDTTITNPGNTEALITTGGYDSRSGSINPVSGRGYTLLQQIKPELTAPSVDVYGPAISDSQVKKQPPLSPYIQKTGTSAAAALTAGAVALLINWGTERQHSFFPALTNRSVKNYLIRGARRRSSFFYPNQEWGYGELDLSGVFSSLL